MQIFLIELLLGRTVGAYTIGALPATVVMMSRGEWTASENSAQEAFEFGFCFHLLVVVGEH